MSCHIQETAIAKLFKATEQHRKIITHISIITQCSKLRAVRVHIHWSRNETKLFITYTLFITIQNKPASRFVPQTVGSHRCSCPSSVSTSYDWFIISFILPCICLTLQIFWRSRTGVHRLPSSLSGAACAPGLGRVVFLHVDHVGTGQSGISGFVTVSYRTL